MTVTLRPFAGFDWIAVSWGGPDEVVSETCSYCDAPIADDDMPLILWNDIGWCARFCTACQLRWWGIESFGMGDFDDEAGDAAPA